MKEIKVMSASEWYSSIYPDEYMDWNSTLASKYANYISKIRLKQGFNAAREKWIPDCRFSTIYSDKLKYETFVDFFEKTIKFFNI